MTPDPDHESGSQDWTMNPDVRYTMAGTLESTKRPIVLVTGAAGSLGKELVKILLEQGCIVRAMDINEAGLSQLKSDNDTAGVQLRLIYGDIRVQDRVNLAARGVDYIIHAAALKNLIISEKNPWEAIRTNIEGTRNVGMAAIENKVNRAIFVSSDKAVEPTTLYGTTKLIGEQLWLWFSSIQERTEFSIFRSGNFKPSSGSVFEIWERQHMQHLPLTVTSAHMHRYFIDIKDAARIAADMIYRARNRQIFVPKMQHTNIYDLKKELYPDDETKFTQPRTGEKTDEKLFNDYEKTSRETEDYWVVER